MPIFDTEEIIRRDAEALHKLGDAQQLRRRMSLFGNFAMSFMIIGVFWGVCVNIQQGLSTAGMFGISAVFLIGCLIAFSTAASLGEISSAIPTAGGLYYWSSVLGGRGWGWATAWINLLAYTFSIGGTAVGIISSSTRWCWAGCSISTRPAGATGRRSPPSHSSSAARQF